MSEKNKRAIVAINVFVIFLMICLFSLGFFASHVSDKVLQAKTIDYNTKLKSWVGQPFTSKHRDRVVGMLDCEDELNTSLIRSLNSLSRVALNLGGISSVLLLLNTLLIVRNVKTAQPPCLKTGTLKN